MRDDGDDVVFLGGKDYIPLFCRLSADNRGAKTVFFKAAQTPPLPTGFRALRFQTRTRTNWHYDCARALVAGDIEL